MSQPSRDGDGPDPEGDRAQVAAVAELLGARHPAFARSTIERLVARAFERYRGARITTFVPILVHRQVGAWLRYADGEPIEPPHTLDLSPHLSQAQSAGMRPPV